MILAAGLKLNRVQSLLCFTLPFYKAKFLPSWEFAYFLYKTTTYGPLIQIKLRLVYDFVH